jgi:DNA-binding CsgD family transcriptional regulator
MDDAEQLSRLIGDIYDAALDSLLWRSVLESTCAYIKGQSGALVAQGPGQRQGHFFFEWGTAPEFLESYQRTYGILNPMHVPTMIYASVGSILASTDIVPHAEILASRFYKEWLTPQGIIDAISVTFEKSAISYAILSIHRNLRHGMVDDEARRRMGLIAPHYRRAVDIAKLIDLRSLEAAAFADSLDGLAAAMILANANGLISHANAAGRSMLAEGRVIRSTGDRLTIADVQADQTMRDILMSAGAGDAALGAKGIAIPIVARDGERYVAHVLPLTSGARRKAGTAYSAVAALFVHKATIAPPHPINALADAYKLTPAEMRVLMMIVQVGSVPEVAPVLGISETTVKTHLQHVFAKTGTSRQADLVKLVAGYMSPLASG